MSIKKTSILIPFLMEIMFTIPTGSKLFSSAYRLDSKTSITTASALPLVGTTFSPTYLK